MFRGSIAALVTPFDEGGEIDFESVERLVEFHVQNASDGLVVAGTTGEAATLSAGEFERLLSRVLEWTDGRLPVLAGTGSASTAKTVEQTRLAERTGAVAVLIVTPYYNRPTQTGLEAHYLKVAEETDLPIVMYNVPSRTGVDMQPETVARLGEHPRIVALKEAVGDTSRIEELTARCGTEFTILSGDDPSCLAAMKCGARGVISVAANVVPRQMHELCTAAARQDWGDADRIESELRELFAILTIESNPIPVKWSLFEMKLIGPGLRLPLTSLGTSHRDHLRGCLENLGLVGT